MQFYRRRPSFFRLTQRVVSIQSFNNQGETVSFFISIVQSTTKHAHTKHAIPLHTSFKICSFINTKKHKTNHESGRDSVFFCFTDASSKTQKCAITLIGHDVFFKNSNSTADVPHRAKCGKKKYNSYRRKHMQF